MYGQGNFAPQVGQGPQRPMPPYQQHPTGYPPPVVQQAGLPYAVPPHGSVYPPAPLFPQNLTQQGPSGSMLNVGNPYMHPPMNVHGGPPVQRPYSTGQQHYTSGTQNSHHIQLPLPPPPPLTSLGLPRVPPPPSTHGQAVYGRPLNQPSLGTQQGIHHMPLQPPLPLGGVTSFRPGNLESAKQPPNADSHVPPMAPPPPPPPLPPSSPPKPPPPPSSWSPSSGNLSSVPTNVTDSASMQSGVEPGSVQLVLVESAANTAPHSQNRDDSSVSNELSLSMPCTVLDLPPPPPKPADEKIVHNIDVLCQFIAKNGLGFEDMARQKEVGNPEFSFLFGGEPGSEPSCAHEYFLWMKKKCGLVPDPHKEPDERDLSQRHVDLEPSGNLNSMSVVKTSHSPVDSDVDMEDDITQSVKESGVCNSVEDFKPEAVSGVDMVKMQKQENDLEYSRDSSSALNLSSSVKLLPGGGGKPEQFFVQTKNMNSPIRLIQGYASDDSSDDDDVPRLEEGKAVVDSPLKSPSRSHEDEAYDILNSKSCKVSESGLAEAVSTKDLDDSDAKLGDGQEDLVEVQKFSFLGESAHDGTVTTEASCPDDTIQEKYALQSSIMDITSTSKEIEREQKKDVSSQLEVDEFGRLVKEGASESESNDSRHFRRWDRRVRSRNRSRSPSERKRRSPRWSPRRWKDRRSRSRSWSPRRRKSRSRSPYRPGADIGSEKPRRDKGQVTECFDFRRGRCYRGASCRYVHHELHWSDSTRRHRSKQHQEVVESSRGTGLSKDYVTSRVSQKNNDVKVEEVHTHLDKPDTNDLSSKTNDEISESVPVCDVVQPSLLHKGDDKICEVSTVGDAQVQEVSDEPICHLPSNEENPLPGLPSTNEQVSCHSQAEDSVQPNRRLDGEPQNTTSSSIQPSAVSSCDIPVCEPNPGNMLNVPGGPNDSGPNLPHIPHLPPPPPLSQATNTQGLNQVDGHSMAPAVSLPPQPVPIGNMPASEGPWSHQQLQYPIPPNPPWTIQPPQQPHPPYVREPSITSAPLHFQQSNLSLRNEFPNQSSLGGTPAQLPGQSGGFPRQPHHLHSSNLPTQPFGSSISQFPSHGFTPSSSFASGIMPPQSIAFPGDSTVRSMHSFPGVNLPFSEPSKPAFQVPPFLLQGPFHYGPDLTAADSRSHPGGSLTIPEYSSDPLNKDHSSRLLDVGVSKISAQYNPYASIFDQPLTSRFNAATFGQEREADAGNKYDSSSSLGHAPLGLTVSGHGLRKMILSPNSRAAGQTSAKLSGDQYDPLFDSIEPSSDPLKKHALKLDHAADNSAIIKKLSSHHNVLDVEENNKQKGVGAVAAATSLENDEFGETADSEVGAVENESPSNPDEDAIGAEGEIEIDQVKKEGKSKKGQDSRSMKLFKIAVANFVKEVLKPQWRQGNMSKEVFKTIVKKTVDKVSGTMKSHRIPKSQAKIDLYIDSSRRKLTQLVEGYVGKYKS